MNPGTQVLPKAMTNPLLNVLETILKNVTIAALLIPLNAIYGAIDSHYL